jgi:hypothetical protein
MKEKEEEQSKERSRRDGEQKTTGEKFETDL